MHLVRLQRPFQRAAAAAVLRPTTTTTTATTSLEDRFALLRIRSPVAANAAVAGRRYATVKSQGAYKLKSKKTIPKKMGAKKTGDQYVIPGNIIYKQRGTIWHPGENTIMGRDHTIHAAVAGYVKYYRDPQRHPKRQYIGVAFNREDKLPYPPAAPRRRKLNMVAVPRKVEEPVEETTAPSGIPLSVTRHEPVAETTTTAASTAAAAEQSTAKLERPIPLVDGNAVVASLVREKLRSRQMGQARAEARMREQQKELEARKATRVFRLQSDYSYRETNWEIGRLVGDAGVIPGTEKTESRKAKFRLRKRRRVFYYRGLKSRRLAKARRREEHARRVRANRERARQQAAAAAAAAAADAAKAAGAAAAGPAKVAQGDDGKVDA
ncbi:eea74b05-bc04-43b8-b864-4b429977105f [Thermothielavioides terrestris]|uniref:Large ribosomal subunit protein bL27m n=1 Tax=Thermothielavioides terrestris TaxID=2587410 RepID=A0A3S5CXJ2_9PEZI|nr:eea74b05-bc04-43b8-b864-4b429977105f [Thermothielavioides terrestris]